MQASTQDHKPLEHHDRALFQYQGNLEEELSGHSKPIYDGSLILSSGKVFPVSLTLKNQTLHQNEKQHQDQNQNQNQQEQPPENLTQGVIQGTMSLGSSLIHGLTGIVSEPYRGAREGGATGFLKGMGKGLTGTVLSPTEGLADLFSKSAEGYRHNLLTRQQVAMKEGMEHHSPSPHPVRKHEPAHPIVWPQEVNFREPSLLIDGTDLRKIRPHLPARCAIADWNLVYSSQRDGININTFYKKMEDVQGPVILLIEDTKGHVIGGFVNEPFHKGKGYYGNGETFVFSVKPRFRVYPWTQANSYFSLSNGEFVALGGGGDYALWLDGDFVIGSSGPCETFDNDVLASSSPFECTIVEAFSFES